MAASLTAQQLSIGSVPLGAGQTGTLTVALASDTAQIAALQFDLSYDRTALTVSIAISSAAAALPKSIYLNDLGTSQRAVIAGGRSVLADGAVAILTVTVAANATPGNRPLTLANLVAADPNANVVPLTGVNGAVNVGTTYLVGDVAPYTSDTAPNFGDGILNILDLTQELFAVNNVTGFVPAPCSDRLDAMDLYPADTATTRGGDGVLDVRDLILELFRVNNLDPSRPVRASLGGCANPAIKLTPAARTAAVRAETGGTLVLGAVQASAAEGERVPVYLQAVRDLARVALTFALGDQRSPLHFVTVAEAPPSLVEDRQQGTIAVAWLQGVSIRAGARLLLGYVTGPKGMAPNLKVYGGSATTLDDNREVRLDAPAKAGREQ
jgi:hypothetical protein